MSTHAQAKELYDQEKADTKVYQVDIKIFSAAHSQEIPYWLPDGCFIGNRLKPGYYSLTMTCNDIQLHDFEAWAREHEYILKIIGLTPKN